MQKLVLQVVYSFFVRWFLKIVVGVRFDDATFLLNEKQFIIVANHNSHLDTMSIMASIPRKMIHKVKPVAAKDHFGKTKVSEMLSNYFINSLLISRKRNKDDLEHDPIHNMVAALDDGYSLILFPEGTRGEPEVEQPLRPGVGFVLSKRPNIKYVPAYMTGMGKALPKGERLIVPFNSTLTYGKPKLVREKKINEILKDIQADFDGLKQATIAHSNS